MSAVDPAEIKAVQPAKILRVARGRLRSLAADVFEPAGVDREVLSDRLDELEELLAALARAL